MKSNDGFTLIEVALAITIAGIALVTLVGLQSRLVDNIIEERSRIDAALSAQYLMSMIEVGAIKVEVGSKTGDLLEHLDDLQFFADAQDDEYKTRLQGWTYRLQVEDLDIGPLEKVLQKIRLAIEWGDAPGDVFEITYFARNSKSKLGALGGSDTSSGESGARFSGAEL